VSLEDIRLTEVMNLMAEGLMVMDLSGRIVLWNQAMERMTGFSESEALGQPCSILECTPIGLDDPIDLPDKCPLLTDLQRESCKRECLLHDKKGHAIPVLRHATHFRGPDKEALGIVEMVSDLRPVKYLEEQVVDLGRDAPKRQHVGGLVGKSHGMQAVYERIGLAGDSEATVLVLGETGTGKELVAEAIHFAGPRKNGPLVKVNCSALSEGLLESELFGHVKGAFTGAVQDRTGRFEAAQGGTLFLDEIGDISPLIQLKLLRVLQEREIEAVGSSEVRAVDVRVIAATHRDLKALVKSGQFRQDLFYRLRVFSIDVPPLRLRKDDIPLLVEAFRDRFNRTTGKAIRNLDSQALHCFMDYCWPGNVRELENAIEHAFVTCQGEEIGLFDLPVELRKTELRAAECLSMGAPADTAHTSTAGQSCQSTLVETLTACNWNKAEVARRLGVDRATIWRKMKQWDIPLQKPEE
jgi:two-component system, NtrC family, response regulator HydG